MAYTAPKTSFAWEPKRQGVLKGFGESMQDLGSRPKTGTTPQGAAPGDSMSGIVEQQGNTATDLAQLRLQGQREFLAPRHLDMSGNAIDPSTGRGAGNAFDTGVFANSAADMTPEARLASQGGSATNQWAQQSGNQGIDAAELQRLNAVRASSYTGGGYGSETFTAPQVPQPSMGTMVPEAGGGASLYASNGPGMAPGTSLAGTIQPPDPRKKPYIAPTPR